MISVFTRYLRCYWKSLFSVQKIPTRGPHTRSNLFGVCPCRNTVIVVCSLLLNTFIFVTSNSSFRSKYWEGLITFVIVVNGVIFQTDMKSITKLICSSSGHKNSLWLLFLVSKFRARPIFLCKSTVLRLGPRKLIINLVGISNVIHISFNENIPCDGWSRAQHASKFFRLLFRIFLLYFSTFLNLRRRRRARDRCNTSFTWRVCFVSPRSSDCVRLCARPRGPPSCRSFDPLVSSGWSLSYMSVWCVYGIPCCRFL